MLDDLGEFEKPIVKVFDDFGKFYRNVKVDITELLKKFRGS